MYNLFMPVLIFFNGFHSKRTALLFRIHVENDDVKKATLHIFENQDKPLNSQNNYSPESQYHVTIAR